MQDEPSKSRFDRSPIAKAAGGLVIAISGVLLAGVGASPILESVTEDVAVVWIWGGAAVAVGGVCLLVFGMMHVRLAFNGRENGGSA